MLVKPYTPERDGSMIELPDIVSGRQAMVDNRAVVVAIGPSAWKDEGFWKPIFGGLFRRWIQVDRAKVGDKVLITKFAGFMAKGTGDEPYRLVNDRDIFCALEGEKA